MLKIKDNVDLKELEKYGFKKVKKDETDFVSYVKYWQSKYDNEYDCITIFDDRTLSFGIDGFEPDVLYDLIKADLVEKVDD